MKRGRPTNYYILYKGETYVTMGTVVEISNELNVTPNTVRYWASKRAKQRCKGNSILAYIMED